MKMKIASATLPKQRMTRRFQVVLSWMWSTRPSTMEMAPDVWNRIYYVERIFFDSGQSEELFQSKSLPTAWDAWLKFVGQYGPGTWEEKEGF